MGTVNVLEAARACASVRAVVIVSSDKCYQNLETDRAVPRDGRHGRPRPVQLEQGLRRARHRGLPRASMFGRRRRRWPRSAPATSSAVATGRRSHHPGLRASPGRRRAASSCGTRPPSDRGSTSSSRCRGISGWPPSMLRDGSRYEGRLELRADRRGRRPAGALGGRAPSSEEWGDGLVDHTAAGTARQPHEAHLAEPRQLPRPGSSSGGRPSGTRRRRCARRPPGTATTTGRLQRLAISSAGICGPTRTMPARQVSPGPRTRTRTARADEVDQVTDTRHEERTPGRDPRAGEPVLPGAPCAAAVRPRPRPGALRRPRVRRRGDAPPGRREPRLLPDRQPLHGGVRGGHRRVPRPVRRAVRQLRFVGQPGGPHGAHVAQARRPPPAGPATRSSRWPPASPPRWRRSSRTAWCRSSSTSAWATTTPTRTSSRAAVSPRTRAIMLAHTLGVPFDLDTVMELVEEHDLWLVEDNCDALGSRYRERLTGTFGHLATLVLLPGAPHHHRRGRHGRHRRRGARPHRPLRPRLGPRLLLRGRREQHLRQAVRPAVRQPAATATTTSTSTATSATTSRPPTCRRPSAAPSWPGSDDFIAARKRNHARLLEALRPYEDRLILPVTPPHTRSVLVLLRDHRARGRRLHAQRADRLPRGQPHRDAQPVQRQPAAPPGLRDDRAPRGRRPRATPTPSWTARSSSASTRASTTHAWTT